jgi:NAD(P)-dependent dehydrogenase (short-subunit alcohol dehydrogenase family)
VTGRLQDQAVVVTGGAAGLGFAYARRFLREGACVLIADIVDPADAIRRLDAGDRAAGCRVDVASALSARTMAAEAVRRFGRIDVLVNNAALFATLKPQPFDAIPEEEWDRVMAVNVRGMWNCVKAVAPAMRARKAGRIVNVASAIVAKGTPFLLHYVSSKGAVIAMTRALARELGDDGIAVNAVAPGLILSDTVQANPAVTGFQSAAVLQSRTFKRDALPEDVEGAVLFLASSDSAFMTGQTLVVDGGSVFA